jgi:hypothetical protein
MNAKVFIEDLPCLGHSNILWTYSDEPNRHSLMEKRETEKSKPIMQ